MVRRIGSGVPLLMIPAVVLGLTACTTSDVSDFPAPSSSTARSTDTAPPVSDTMDAAGAAEAVSVAVSAMAAFVDHDRPYDQWWAEFSDYLGGDALVAYEFTDPALVPASGVTGDGEVSAAPDATQITVLVPTDVGQYQVVLNRQAVGGEWTVSRLTPPEGLE